MLPTEPSLKLTIATKFSFLPKLSSAELIEEAETFKSPIGEFAVNTKIFTSAAMKPAELFSIQDINGENFFWTLRSGEDLKISQNVIIFAEISCLTADIGDIPFRRCTLLFWLTNAEIIVNILTTADDSSLSQIRWLEDLYIS